VGAVLGVVPSQRLQPVEQQLLLVPRPAAAQGKAAGAHVLDRSQPTHQVSNYYDSDDENDHDDDDENDHDDDDENDHD